MLQTNNRLPRILSDIVSFLKQHPICISKKIEGEARVASLIDEGVIKKTLLNSPFQKYIVSEKPRSFGDIFILDYDLQKKYPVNIKTSIGGCDNCCSKGGFVYAFTSLEPENIPRRMNFIKMNELLHKFKADILHKDYYFLCIDKKNSTNVMIRGSKQIRHWKVNINPSNILQINWKKEKNSDPIDRSWDEAYNVIIGGIQNSLSSFVQNIPEDWKHNTMSSQAQI